MTKDANWKEKETVRPLKSSEVEVEVPRSEYDKERSQDEKA